MARKGLLAFPVLSCSHFLKLSLSCPVLSNKIFLHNRDYIPCSATTTTMSTLDGASIYHNSDSEDDLDYVPEGEEHGVITTLFYRELPNQTFHLDSDGSVERDTKRPRVGSPPPTQEDLAAAKRCGYVFLCEKYLNSCSVRQALWAQFQDSVNAPSSLPPAESEPKRTVKVEKRHRFAGEDVV